MQVNKLGAIAWRAFGALLVLASSAGARGADPDVVQIPEPAAAPEAVAPPDAADAPDAAAAPSAPEPTLGNAPGVIPTKERRIVLTISGGISLGSYEAGLNWTLLRLIKASQNAPPPGAFAYPMDLVAMTGASAGNINAFLSAVEWLSTPSAEHPTADPRWTSEGNLFWSSWIPVGLDQLFPGDRTCVEYEHSLGGDVPCDKHGSTYDPTDAVFSRRAFRRIIADLLQRMREPFADTDRTFPLAVTLTKVKPERVEGTSLQSLDVKTQRFAVLLTAEVRNGRLVFSQPRAKNAGLVGNQLFLRSKDGLVEHEDVIQLIQAASAFPLAFGPVNLSYCLPAQYEAGQCKKLETEPFLDGGLFDNLPLGLALETISQTRTYPSGGEQLAPGIDYTLMYLDPERRRNLSPKNGASPGQAPAETARGIDYLLTLVGRFISVARSYELQSSIRFGSSMLDRPEGTSRYLPLFGGYLGAFAGFLARPFREFDFHAGVYDGLYQVASLSCDGAAPQNPQSYSQQQVGSLQVQRAACMLEKVQTYLQLLGIRSDSATGYVVSKTLPLELRDVVPDERASAFEQSHQRELAQMQSVQPMTPRAGTAAVTSDLRLMKELYAGMQAVRASHLETGHEPTFASVLDTLGDLNDVMPAGNKDHYGQALFGNRDALIGNVARQLATRLVNIEDTKQAAPAIPPSPAHDATPAPRTVSRKPIGPLVATGAQFLAETYFNGLEYEERLEWTPSSVPRGAGAIGKAADILIPYYVTGEVRDGGFEVGYLPTWHLWGSGAGLTVPFAPVSWKRGSDVGGRVGLDYMLSGRLWLFTRFEAGAYVRSTYDKDPDVWGGGELAVQLLFNHLRISANVDALHAVRATEPEPAGSRWDLAEWSIRAGLADVNGLVYWLARVR